VVTVAVLGHHGMLGRVVARRFAEKGARIMTTDQRHTLALVAWARHADLIVNCAYEPDSWETNAVLPVLLARAGHLIQPSTDAINEDSDYAAEKRMAETANAVVIRCSIVGSKPPPPVAFTNWTWNGITPLTWADVAWEARERPVDVIVPGTAPISRQALYETVADVYGYRRPEAQEAPTAVDRALEVTWPTPPIREQLLRLRDWERMAL
jgi:nucleoside-diphosphate-sugar epimerase